MPRVVVAPTLFGMLAIATSIMLSACGQKRDGDPLVLDPKAESGRVEDKFGDGFGKAFRAEPNSAPRDVKESDVKPVSLTTEPVPID